jgi:hypothetical protein
MKMSTTIAFWLHLRVLGGLVGGSRGCLEASWREVGPSWAILASSRDLMAACWKKDGEEERKDANLVRTWVAKSNERQFGGKLPGAAGSKIARTGGCLELDFRDLERS